MNFCFHSLFSRFRNTKDRNQISKKSHPKMAFSKNLALLAASGALCAEALTNAITVQTTNATKTSATISQTELMAAQAVFQKAIQEAYSTTSSCKVEISSNTSTTSADGVTSWDIELKTSGSGFQSSFTCAQSVVAGLVAVSSSKLVDEYNKQIGSTNQYPTGTATKATGVSTSSVSGLSAMVTSAAAAMMMMVL